MRRLMGLAVGCFLAMTVWAPAARVQEVPQDRKDIRQDRRDIRQDRRDIARDQQDVNRDRRDRARDRGDLNKDRRDLRRDRRDLRADHRDVGKTGASTAARSKPSGRDRRVERVPRTWRPGLARASSEAPTT